ncbi:MAG TPA: DMT family transporter [Gaiellaceae bacterium]
MRRRRAGHGDARRTSLSVLALVLALASSVVWGGADFAGGSLTRRLPAFAVTVVSQAAGFVVLLVAIGIRGDLGTRSLLLGLLAGLGGGAGLAAFYRALSLGTMSVVSPIAACGAAVPFAISIASGERPSPLAVGGAAVALGGAVLASVEERRAKSPERARAIVLALVAAIALGLFIYFLGLGSREGDALSTLVGARVGSLGLLVAIAGVRRAPLRVPRAFLPAVAAVGIADVSANALFAFASGHGLLSLVSVLGSLYPVMTVLLAHVLLGERLTRAQKIGVAAALAGVAVISAA